MSKRSNNKGYSFDRASPEQLAKLSALHKEQLALYQFLNRPFNLIFNALVLPAVFHFLFFKKNSWFEFLSESYRPYHGILENEKFTLFLEALINAAKENIHIFETDMFRNCESIQFKTQSISRCYDYFEKNYPGDAYSLRKKLIQGINIDADVYLKYMRTIIENTDIPTIVHALNPEESSLESIIISFRRVHQILDNILLDFVSKKSLFLGYGLGKLEKAYAIHQIIKVMRVVIIGVAAIVQKVFLDPLLLIIKPGRAVVPNEPLIPYLHCQRNFAEAEIEIKALTQRVSTLKKSANYNKTLARYVLLLAVILVIYNFVINPIESSPSIILLCMGVVATALKDGFQDTSDWWQSRQQMTYLKNFEDNLGRITQSIATKEDKGWQRGLGSSSDDLKSIYFYIDLESQEQISGKIAARKLEYYLQLQGIATYHSNDSQVFIPADEKLNADRTKIVAKNFSAAILRLQDIYKLKLQILQIIKKLIPQPSLLQIPYQDKMDLPTARFHIEITDFVMTRLEVFFEKLKNVGTTIRHEMSLLIIEGYSPLDDKQMVVVQSSLTNSRFIPSSLSGNESSSNFRSWEAAYSESTRKNNPKTKPAKNEEKKSEIRTQSHTIIRWGTDCYVPNDEKCLVQLMRPSILSQNRHFVVFKLEQKHMPVGYPNNLYQKLRQSTLQAPIGTKGQGWKFVSATLCNDLITGENRVSASAKFRNYGEFGDLRLFARSTTVRTSDGDKILHRVVGLDPHAHQ